MTDKKNLPDWERIEFDYRAGIKSLREIADSNGITEGAIRKRAKRDSWERDLKAKINAKVESLVRKEAVRNEVRNGTAYQATEREIVEANATLSANALLSHRKDITRGRSLTIKLLEEIESQTSNHELFASLGLMLAAPDEKGVDKLNELYLKVIGTPSRIDSMKKLSDTLKTLIALERQAIGLKDDALPMDDDKIVRIELVAPK
jgi:predicted DNA-binding protein YlxM (UPF0122 family)